MAEEFSTDNSQGPEGSPNKEPETNVKLIRAMVMDGLSRGGGFLTALENSIDGGLEAAVSRGKVVGRYLPDGKIQFGFEVDVEEGHHDNYIAWHITTPEDNLRIEAVLRATPNIYGSILEQAEEGVNLSSENIAAPGVHESGERTDQAYVESPHLEEEELLMLRYQIFRDVLSASPSKKVELTEEVRDKERGTTETGIHLLLELQDENTITVTDYENLPVFPFDKVGKFSAEGENREMTFHYRLTSSGVQLNMDEIARVCDSAGGWVVVVPYERSKQKSVQTLAEELEMKWSVALALPKNYLGTNPKIDDLLGNANLPWLDRRLVITDLE